MAKVVAECRSPSDMIRLADTKDLGRHSRLSADRQASKIISLESFIKEHG